MQFKDDGPIDADGEITNASTRKFLQGFVDRYVDWVQRFVA
jgi:chromate reductase